MLQHPCPAGPPPASWPPKGSAQLKGWTADGHVGSGPTESPPPPPGQLWPPVCTLGSGTADWREGPLGTAGPGGVRATHLLHTMAMTTTAMRKTRPAAEEPMTRGSFSWMLVWYSAGRKHRASQPGSGVLTLHPCPSPPRFPGPVLLLTAPVTCLNGESHRLPVTLGKSVDWSTPQSLIYKMSTTPTSPCCYDNQRLYQLT